MRPIYRYMLSMFVLLTGCEFGTVATRNTNIMDTLEKQYKIYEDLERNKTTVETNCQIQFNDPEESNIRTGASGALPNRNQDAARWSEQVARETGTTSSFPNDPLPPVSTSDAQPASSSGGISNRLFGNGDGSVSNDNRTNLSTQPSTDATNGFSSPEEVDNLDANNPPRTFGTRENTVFTLTIKEINPVNFNDIKLSHLTGGAATVETLGVAQLTMKDARTNRLQEQPYDDVDVIIKYYLEETAQGTWRCKDSSVDITTTPVRRGNDDNEASTTPTGNAIIRW